MNKNEEIDSRIKTQEDREIDEKIDREFAEIHNHVMKTWDEADVATRALADSLVTLSSNREAICYDGIPLAVLLMKIARGLGLN